MNGADRIDHYSPLQDPPPDRLQTNHMTYTSVVRDACHAGLSGDLGTRLFTNSSIAASAAVSDPPRLGHSGLRDRESEADVVPTLISLGCSARPIGHEWMTGSLKDDLPAGSLLMSTNSSRIRESNAMNVVDRTASTTLQTDGFYITDTLPDSFRYDLHIDGTSLGTGPTTDFGMSPPVVFSAMQSNSEVTDMAGVRKIAKASRRLKDKQPKKSPSSTLGKIQIPVALDKTDKIAIRNKKVSLYVVKCLLEYGFCVVDNYLGSVDGDKVVYEVKMLEKLGLFEDGQVVQQSDDSKTIRGDRIMWVDREDDIVTHTVALVKRLDGLLLNLNGKLGHCQIKSRSKAMVACYPGHGRGYMRHVDNPTQDGRCITCIYYLNKDWDANMDGGLLKIHSSKFPNPIAVEPQFDRLLFFWSDHRNPHEVQPAFRNRYAITVWYFDDEERHQAKLRYFQQGVQENKRLMPVSLMYDS